MAKQDKNMHDNIKQEDTTSKKEKTRQDNTRQDNARQNKTT